LGAIFAPTAFDLGELADKLPITAVEVLQDSLALRVQAQT
jgi:hypothetical protein